MYTVAWYIYKTKNLIRRPFLQPFGLASCCIYWRLSDGVCVWLVLHYWILAWQTVFPFSACFPPPLFRTSGIGQTRRIAQKTGFAFPAFLLVGGISALFLLVDMISQLFNCRLVYIVQKTQVAFPPFPLVGGISALFCYWLT